MIVLKARWLFWGTPGLLRTRVRNVAECPRAGPVADRALGVGGGWHACLWAWQAVLSSVKHLGSASALWKASHFLNYNFMVEVTCQGLGVCVSRTVGLLAMLILQCSKWAVLSRNLCNSWRREWQPTPVFLPGEFRGQRSLAICSPWDPKESDRPEQASPHFVVLQHRREEAPTPCTGCPTPRGFHVQVFRGKDVRSQRASGCLSPSRILCFRPNRISKKC